MKKAYIVWGVAVVVLVGAIWYLATDNAQKQAETSASLANPASTYCVQKLGGQVDLVTESDGQVGYCHLPDGRVCEEWAMFHGDVCVPQGAAASTTMIVPPAGTSTIQVR